VRHRKHRRGEGPAVGGEIAAAEACAPFVEVVRAAVHSDHMCRAGDPLQDRRAAVALGRVAFMLDDAQVEGRGDSTADMAREIVASVPALAGLIDAKPGGRDCLQIRRIQPANRKEADAGPEGTVEDHESPVMGVGRPEVAARGAVSGGNLYVDDARDRLVPPLAQACAEGERGRTGSTLPAAARQCAAVSTRRGPTSVPEQTPSAS
jgi:hypothetical protein